MRMALKVGSLFAGIGGIDLGLLQAGYKIEWAIENDPACCRTYRHNFPENSLLEQDIKNVDPLTLPSIDVLAAGFPCQSFSMAGRLRGFSDPRGFLFYEVVRFAEKLHPQCIFLENVPYLMEHDNGRTFLEIHNVLSELGYSIRYKVMRASEYGNVPQIRDRIYIIAFQDLSKCERFEFPNQINLTVSIEDILQRNQKKHSAYYYNIDDVFYKKASSIVTKGDAIYRVYHDSIKVTQNYMCPTLTASMGTRSNQVPLLIDDFGIRKLTVQECLDFMGFPNGFSIPHSNTISDAYKQIGNSVCVPVIRRIAIKLKGIFSF